MPMMYRDIVLESYRERGLGEGKQHYRVPAYRGQLRPEQFTWVVPAIGPSDALHKFKKKFPTWEAIVAYPVTDRLSSQFADGEEVVKSLLKDAETIYSKFHSWFQSWEMPDLAFAVKSTVQLWEWFAAIDHLDKQSNFQLGTISSERRLIDMIKKAVGE